MHVISRKPFRDASRDFPNDADAINAVYKTLRNGKFTTPDELRAVFPSLDNFRYKNRWWIIDIGGNNLRLIALVLFQQQRLYVKHIVKHAEYDKLTKKYAKEAD